MHLCSKASFHGAPVCRAWLLASLSLSLAPGRDSICSSGTKTSEGSGAPGTGSERAAAALRPAAGQVLPFPGRRCGPGSWDFLSAEKHQPQCLASSLFLSLRGKRRAYIGRIFILNLCLLLDSGWSWVQGDLGSQALLAPPWLKLFLRTEGPGWG